MLISTLHATKYKKLPHATFRLSQWREGGEFPKTRETFRPVAAAAMIFPSVSCRSGGVRVVSAAPAADPTTNPPPTGCSPGCPAASCSSRRPLEAVGGRPMVSSRDHKHRRLLHSEAAVRIVITVDVSVSLSLCSLPPQSVGCEEGL